MALDMDVQQPVLKHSVHTLVFRSLKRTHDMFLSEEGKHIPEDEAALRMKIACKVHDEHSLVKDIAPPTEAVAKLASKSANKPSGVSTGHEDTPTLIDEEIPTRKSDPVSGKSTRDDSQSLVLSRGTQQLVPRKALMTIKPIWHAPWKLMRVISGHLGWVRCISVDPSNEWFATGSGDRTIKLWELGTGRLKLTLTGHISSIRGLAVSPRQPYLFSVGEDKLVKCWDLEQNKVVRHYHGHLSGVHAVSIHPTIDILVTGGRDATARVWDMRTKACIHTLSGHTNTIADLFTQAGEPQVVTGSHDSTIRLWDIIAGKTRAVLTNHKKSVRALVNHPSEFTFASASPDNIKQWKFPDGNFMQNLSGHQAIVNALAINSDGVLVSGGDNGSMHFWDWRSGHCFQKLQTQVQPGSLDSEAGIFATTFDMSGCRLITAEADKTIKIYKEDEDATEDTHPVEWRPEIMRRKRY